MDSFAYIKLLLSFFVGGGIVVMVTYLAEKLGSRIGGIIAGIPTTISISRVMGGNGLRFGNCSLHVRYIFDYSE